MKTKLYIGMLLFAIGLTDVIYWFYYCFLNEKLALSNDSKFMENYYNSLPSFIRPLIISNLSTILLILIFFISGLFFWKSNKIIFKIAAVIAFVLSFLQLFSLM